MLRSEATSMQEVAQRIAGYFYEGFKDPETSRPSCPLVRVYKTHAFGDLPSDLQDVAGAAADERVTKDTKCFVLLGTAGDKPEWNVPALSTGHRAVPLSSAAAVERLPMISRLFSQLGLDVHDVVAPDSDAIFELEQQTFNVFHVPDAVHSPYLPAQEDFVVPHGIRSALGFGGVLQTGDLYAVILFSRAPIDPKIATLFRVIALTVKRALFPFQDRVFG